MVDFPNTPIEGQTHTEEGQTWTYIDGAWIVGLNSANLLEIVDNDVTDPSASWAVFGDTMIQWGFNSPGSAVEQVITFPKPFKASPRVAANNNSQSNGQFVQTYSLQPESFTCTTRDSSDNITNGGVSWIAVGEATDDLKKPKAIPYGAGGGGGTGTGNVTTGSQLPPTPSVGDLHYLTVAPVGLYVYYNDGDSNQWVQANGANVPPQRQIYRLRVGSSYGWTNGNNVGAKIIFDTEVARLGPSFATYSAGVFTFTEAGWYDIDAAVRWQGPIDGLRTLGFLDISKNDGGGTATQAVGYNRNLDGTNFDTDLASVAAKSLIYADVGDTAEVYLTFRKESGNGPTVSHTVAANGTWVNIERVG